MNPLQAASILSRAGFGPVPGQIKALAAKGPGDWIDLQIKSSGREDPAAEESVAKAVLRLKHGAGEEWEARDEMLPLAFLRKSAEELWAHGTSKDKRDGTVKRRPRDEAACAAVLRARSSSHQLHEALVGFWHDHFNVDFTASDTLAALLPSYDRDVVRAHCAGNFRVFLEAVARSPAMLLYLSNRSSRAGAANENYARELFELHTLGRGAYLNDRYDRWRDVPGAKEGRPAGYIDQDVYEAARAFTGWTVEDGTALDGKRRLPDTGRFAYVDQWHDGYQKRILAREIQPFSAALSDGRKVLDQVAAHPATARFIASKLVFRLTGGADPALVSAAAEEFSKNAAKDDQIAKTAAVVLASRRFQDPIGPKIKRPLALAVSFARAAGIEMRPSEGLLNGLSGCGQRLFGWPTPTGLPDEDGRFLGAQAMRSRWALLAALAEDSWGCGPASPPPEVMEAKTASAAAEAWTEVLLGAKDANVAAAAVFALGWRPEEPAAKPGAQDAAKRLARLGAACAMCPAFQSA